MSYKEP